MKKKRRLQLLALSFILCAPGIAECTTVKFCEDPETGMTRYGLVCGDSAEEFTQARKEMAEVLEC